MEEEEIEISGISWEKPHFYLNGKIFVPKIYDAPKLESPIPEGFNAVKIAIDGKMQSDLNWKAVSEFAQKHIEQGLQLFWEIDLGLFSNLPNPLSNQSQYLSLGLSLEHFRDTLWKEFRNYTLGLSVYRGTADLSENFPWDDEQRRNLIEWLRAAFSDIEIFRNETGVSSPDFESIDQHLLNTTKTGSQIRTLFCRDAAAEYLEMLTNRIPDALQLFLLMDCSRIADPLTQMHAVSRERFDRFHLAVKGGIQGLSDFTWDSGFFTSGLIASEIKDEQPLEKQKVGLCIPPTEFCRPSHYQELEKDPCRA